jgi:hypothetical protein
VKDSEAEIKVKIKRYLKKLPNSKFVSYCPFPHGEVGTPDYIGCINGKTILIEVKCEGNALSKIQMLRCDEWLSAKAKVIIAHSVEELKKQLNNII